MLQKTLETLRTGIITILFILSTSCYSVELIPIKKGDTSSIDGFVISKETEKHFRELNERFKLSQQKVVKLEDLQVNRERTVKQFEIYSSRLENNIAREEFIGSLKGIGGFLLGILATSLALQAAKKSL